MKTRTYINCWFVVGILTAGFAIMDFADGETDKAIWYLIIDAVAAWEISYNWGDRND